MFFHQKQSSVDNYFSVAPYSCYDYNWIYNFRKENASVFLHDLQFGAATWSAQLRYMKENYNIRMATPKDAAALLEIYAYYVKETAITYEYDVPSVEEFKGRIEKVLTKFPYLVIEGKSHTDESKETSESCNGAFTDGTSSAKILGYAYASPFHERAAYQWCAEMSIYLKKDNRRCGLGRMLYEELEKRLKDQGLLNLYACIGYPDHEDEYLSYASVHFHEKMGYSMIGVFHKCGYKFDRWYNMVWMEKIIGEHKEGPVALF